MHDLSASALAACHNPAFDRARWCSLLRAGIAPTPQHCPMHGLYAILDLASTILYSRHYSKRVTTLTKLVMPLALAASGLKTFINENPICSGSYYINPPPSTDLEQIDGNTGKKWTLPKLNQMTVEPASLKD